MALPTLAVIDSFKRALENPLSNGGKWAKLFPEAGVGEVDGSESWKGLTAFTSGEDGAYWTPAEFTNPAIAVALVIKLVGLGERYYQLWACVSNPTTTEISGYRVRFIEPAEGGVAGVKGKVLIERCVKNAFTTLATITEVSWALGDLIALQVNGGKVIAWHKSGAGAWTVVGEGVDAAFTKGFVGMGMKGNLGHYQNAEAGETVTAHSHTLSSSNGQSPVRRATPARALAQAQAQSPAAARTVAHAYSAAQGQSPAVVKAPSRALAATQTQAISRSNPVGRVFGLTQASSYGPQLPETAITDNLESPGEFNAGATWTVLAWAEALGSVRELNSGIVGKPHPKGWGNAEGKRAGARYNALSLADPINLTAIRNAPELGVLGSEQYVAIGVCVPSSGERSGYVARIEGRKVTIERWINGAKTVLAEATLAETFFTIAAETTTKMAPFALTLVGHTLRLWLSPAAETAPTILLEATDTTFTSGYNTMEEFGAKAMLSRMHVASMDGQIALAQAFSKGQLLTATQGSSATRGATQVARTLVRSQSSSSSFARVLTRAVSTTQGSAAARSAAVTRSLTAAQAQAVSRSITASRAFAATQPQAIFRSAENATQLACNATQVVAQRSVTSRALSAAQPQAPSRSTAILRTLGAGATPVASRIVGLARTLTSTGQGQAPGLEGGRTKLLGASQGQETALARALARTLTASPASSTTLGRSPARLLSAVAAPGAALRRQPARSLGSSTSSSPTIDATQVGHSLVATQGQAVVIARFVARHLAAADSSVVSISFATIEVPLPPPVNMSSSTTGKAYESSAAAKPPSSSVGGDMLSSSVEAR